MKAIILLLAIVSAFSFNLRQTKQNYDSYVMAVQWPNGYCEAKNCGGKDSVVPANTMTIHGLWPSLKSGNRLKECTSGVKIKDDSSSLFSSVINRPLSITPIISARFSISLTQRMVKWEELWESWSMF